MSNKQQLFEAKYNNITQRLCEGAFVSKNQDGSSNPNKKRMLETMYRNTLQHLKESATSGSTSAANVATLNKVILPVIRRVMPTIIANEIIGVQPMTGPVAQIHTMRVKYATTAAGVTAGQEMFSPYNIASAYTGNGNANLPRAGLTADMEGRFGNQASIETLKQTVTAGTRKLAARWTPEAAQDMQAQQGIDLEGEMVNIIAQEMVAEIDQEILGRLVALPGAPTLVFDQNSVTGVPTFVGDVHAALALMINRQANLIASRTRRGPANWVVVSNAALTILQSASTSAFARTTEGTFEAPTNTKYVGTLNNSLRVYVNNFWADNAPVLVGYKGQNEMDAAAFYCPYVPLMQSGTLTDPNTFEQVTQFMTRYGYVDFTDTTSSFGNSADFLGIVGISNISYI
jgi:hypothetical protein